MNFDNLAKTWDCFGETDPMWSILTEEDKKGNKWDPDEFFHRGELEIEAGFYHGDKIKKLTSHARSLDFGCGVGRLTLALASRFEESHGVDISEGMINHANGFKESRNVANAFYHLNRRNNLELFQDSYFDYIISLIVLQHMEPRYFTKYIEEFVRVLKPDGLAVFQLPVTAEDRAHYEIFEEGMEPMMEIFGMEKEDVVSIIEAQGGKIVAVVDDHSFGDYLAGYKYYVTK